jgi:hypothetical protein
MGLNNEPPIVKLVMPIIGLIILAGMIPAAMVWLLIKSADLVCNAMAKAVKWAGQ